MHRLKVNMATTSWSLLKQLRRQSPSDFLQVAASGRSVSLGHTSVAGPFLQQEMNYGNLSEAKKLTANSDIEKKEPPISPIPRRKFGIAGLQTVRALSSDSGKGNVGKNKYNETDDLLSANPYYGKYSGKLKQKQLLEPDNYQSRLDELQEERKKFADEMREKAQEEEARLKTMKANKRHLDSVMKLDLVKNKSAEEIETIWTEYHKDKNCIFAVIAKNEYDQIQSRARDYRTFLYPLPRGSGYEFFVQQFDGNQVYFTPLIAIQTHQENAPACLTITHYTELMDDKEIVLMKGEHDSKIISVHEAQLLALQVKMYYGLRSGLRFNLVRLMTNSPDNFRHMDLIKEFENLKRDSKDYKEIQPPE